VDNEGGDLNERLEQLTPRERTILQGLVEGLDRDSIGIRLGVPTSGVRTSIQNILTKLRVHSSLEAVALVRSTGHDDEPA
jgi:DNA-binding NarL/FixJ family response regulator